MLVYSVLDLRCALCGGQLSYAVTDQYPGGVYTHDLMQYRPGGFRCPYIGKNFICSSPSVVEIVECGAVGRSSRNPLPENRGAPWVTATDDTGVYWKVSSADGTAVIEIAQSIVTDGFGYRINFGKWAKLPPWLKPDPSAKFCGLFSWMAEQVELRKKRS